MLILKDFLVGLFVLLVGGAIVAAFRARQLYFIVPKMLAHGGLTGKGQIAQLQIFNRGRQMEEDIRITVPESLKCELVAADSPEVNLKGNVVLLSRLPPRSNVTAILLVENPTQTEIQSAVMTSRASKGRQVKRLQDVPQNLGNVVLGFFAAVCVLGLLLVVPERLSDYLNAQRKQELADRYAYLTDDGWDSLDSFFVSPSRLSYGDHEFPLALLSTKNTAGTFDLNFSIANKTAMPLTASAYFTAFTADRDHPTQAIQVADTSTSAFNVQVNPLSASTIHISLEGLHSDVTPASLYAQFAIELLDGNRYYVRFYPARNSAANDALAAALRAHPKDADRH